MLFYFITARCCVRSKTPARKKFGRHIVPLVTGKIGEDGANFLSLYKVPDNCSGDSWIRAPLSNERNI